MKLAFCSEFNDEEVNWVHVSQVPITKAVQFHARPNKTVLGIILLLEQGKFPVIKTNQLTDYPLKESASVHEAYLRCHMSVIPTLPIEVEGVAIHVDIDDLPPGQEEPDGGEPFDPNLEPRERDR